MNQANNKIRAHLATIPTVSQDDSANSSPPPADEGGTNPTKEVTNEVGAPPQVDDQSHVHQETLVVELDDNKDTPENEHLEQQIHPTPPDKTTQPETTRPNAPILCRLDRVNSALPQRMMMLVETIRMATGYSKSDPLINNIKNLGTGTVHVRRHRYAIDKLDTGATPSIRRVNSNKNPGREPTSTTGAEWHMDIVFGP